MRRGAESMNSARGFIGRCAIYKIRREKEIRWTIGGLKEGGLRKAGTWSIASNINSRRKPSNYAVAHRQMEEGEKWGRRREAKMHQTVR